MRHRWVVVAVALALALPPVLSVEKVAEAEVKSLAAAVNALMPEIEGVKSK